MRRIRQLIPLLLVAAFWLAQIQGTVHVVGHLANPAQASDRATLPHSVLCTECAALAQAGAAPVLSLPTVAVPTVQDAAIDVPAPASLAAAPAASYRSRAPPLTSI